MSRFMQKDSQRDQDVKGQIIRQRLIGGGNLVIPKGVPVFEQPAEHLQAAERIQKRDGVVE
jgi:hypothetical protein